MRLIDADELIEHVWRDRLDTRERIANLVKSMPTIKETEGVGTVGKFTEDDRRYNGQSYKCNQCQDQEIVRSASMNRRMSTKVINIASRVVYFQGNLNQTLTPYLEQGYVIQNMSPIVAYQKIERHYSRYYSSPRNGMEQQITLLSQTFVLVKEEK